MTMPTPTCPELTASGTPKERSVIERKLPAMFLMVRQPFSQPSPWRMVSIVRCVVPERAGEAIETWS